MDYKLVLYISFGGLLALYKGYKELEKRIERLENKVYDLEENTIKKKKPWEE